MTKHQKLVLTDLLRIWRNNFGDNWFTAEYAFRVLYSPSERDLLRQIGIKNGDGEELNRRLDEVRNKLLYNFVVKRDLPYMQPVQWRVLLQDNRVNASSEEMHDYIAVRREAGLQIDPATAEVDETRGNYFDPYEMLGGDVPWGPVLLYWARSPGSDIWVAFRDLPVETAAELGRLLETGEKSFRWSYTEQPPLW